MAGGPEGVSSMSATVIADVSNRLGEGCLWHPRLKRLFWFDILSRQLFWCDVDGAGLDFVNLDVMTSAAAWIVSSSRAPPG